MGVSRFCSLRRVAIHIRIIFCSQVLHENNTRGYRCRTYGLLFLKWFPVTPSVCRPWDMHWMSLVCTQRWRGETWTRTLYTADHVRPQCPTWGSDGTKGSMRHQNYLHEALRSSSKTLSGGAPGFLDDLNSIWISCATQSCTDVDHLSHRQRV